MRHRSNATRLWLLIGLALLPIGCRPIRETDPDLIAGLELRSGSGVLRNSLAHDLQTLADAMKHGD